MHAVTSVVPYATETVPVVTFNPVLMRTAPIEDGVATGSTATGTVPVMRSEADPDDAIAARPETSDTEMASSVLTCGAVSAIGVAGDVVLFPMMLLAANAAIFGNVTAPAWTIAVMAVVPDPATSPESVIV
jgi:hypothetical protein